MQHLPAPNGRVWSLGQQYVEASELLLDSNRLLPSAVLAALAIEILLKSFLADNDDWGRSTTERGHNLSGLFKQFTSEDSDALVYALKDVNPKIVLKDELEKFDFVFTKARYFYEPEAPKSVASEIIYLARDLCDAVRQVGKGRTGAQ